MKSNLAENTEVIVSGAQQSGNFNIEANGKAFKILIDGLYSNKIQAIIRELSSNAFDAQIAADRGHIPFDIQLPNYLDPTFMVRDYGTSLAHEDIMGLYTTIFKSTKENTNLAIGKFGLGSKTPFAYTDSFTVTAFLRGTKRVYGAYVDITGIPMISLMASEDTSELDGLMVTFPVNVKDCERFRTEMERVYEGFDVKPNVKGASVAENTRKVIHEGSNFKIFDYHYGGSKARAKQGCVIYPIDINALPTLTDEQRQVLTSNILIDFPIGQLDITPSRETLSYDDETIKNILVMADKIDAELVAEIKQAYKSVRTMYEAKCFKESESKNGVASISNFLDKLEFNGKKVYNHQSMARDKLRQNYGVAIKYFPSYDTRSERKTLKFTSNSNSYNTTWYINSKTIFIIDKEGERVVHSSARIKNNLKKHDNIVWIRDIDSTPAKLRSLRKLLGFPPKIVELKSLALPERVKPDLTDVVRISKNECHVLSFVAANDAGTVKDVIDLENLDPDMKYIISYKDYYLMDENKEDHVPYYRLTELFPDLTKIVAVKKQHLNKLKKAGMRNALEDRKNELFKLCDFKKHYDSTNFDKRMDHMISEEGELFKNACYKNDTSFKKVLDFLEFSGSVDTTFKDNDHNIILWQIMVPNHVYRQHMDPFKNSLLPEETLSYWVEQLQKDYPLSKYIISTRMSNFSQQNADDLINYVKLVDESKN